MLRTGLKFAIYAAGSCYNTQYISDESLAQELAEKVKGLMALKVGHSNSLSIYHVTKDIVETS